MTTSITNKRDIALNYVGISARKLNEAQGDFEQALNAAKLLKHYIELARENGCSGKEITLALGMSEGKRTALGVN
jgi:hypothetical protein